MPRTTGSAQETADLAQEIAHRVAHGVIGLYGELGAGKTQFVKGFCAARGIPPETVTSPTFKIVNEYNGSEGPIYHIDAYRVGSPDEFYELGYEEYFFGAGICLIEWPERVEELLPENALRIKFEHVTGDTRRIYQLQAAD